MSARVLSYNRKDPSRDTRLARRNSARVKDEYSGLPHIPTVISITEITMITIIVWISLPKQFRV